jgi:hypothetical protein
MIFSKGLNLLGDVVTYAKQLGIAEDKIKLMVNLLKPAVV